MHTSLIPRREVDRWVAGAWLSVTGNLLVAAAKIALGLSSASLFLMVCGTYSVGLALARYLCLKGHQQGCEHLNKHDATGKMVVERAAYRRAGAVLLAAGAGFIAYCASMVYFGAGAGAHYDSTTGITIAAIAFIETGFAVSGIAATKSKGEPALAALKLTSLAGALVSLVLAQVALLSFTGSGTPASDGMGGLFMGGGATLVGLFMVMHARRASMPLFATRRTRSGKVPNNLQRKGTSHERMRDN